MTRRLNLALLLIMVVVGLPYYWLMIDNHVGNRPAHPIDIETLRHLAASVKGQAPTAITAELVASRSIPGNVLAAGSGVKPQLVAVMAYRVDVAGGPPIMIDSGMTHDQAQAMSMAEFVPTAQAKVDAGLLHAGLILLTHEHTDHSGGLLALARRHPEMLRRVRLNHAQLGSLSIGLVSDALVLPDRPLAVAPGIVVFPTPGHTAGSQMIYVRLADGSEYLFAGDTASKAVSWKEIRGRSRLLTDYLAPENRPAVASWQRTIMRLHQQSPRLFVVPGHDLEWVSDPRSQNHIRLGFAPPMQIR